MDALAASQTSFTFWALLHLIVALAAVIGAGRIINTVLRAIGQPAVMGEMLGGILLGPSLLGRLAPELSAYILPAQVAPLLNLVAQFGVVLYMFMVGLELDLDFVRRRARHTVVISQAGIVAPFILGMALAFYLHPRWSSTDVSPAAFALFIGVAMSITAFPVLARILTDRRMSTTELGRLALTCSAVDDVTAWCLLAFVVGVANATVGGALATMILTIAFIAFMFFVVRPLVTKAVERRDAGPLDAGTVVLAFAGVAASSLTTQAIGVHAIFGAFLLGAVIPHRSTISQHLRWRLQQPVTIFLLPAFFAFTGMRTEIGRLSGVPAWLTCALIIIVATAGKFGGVTLAARLAGSSWHQAARLGVLMNTRGLMELIVLTIGLDLRVISPAMFAMMVLMALVTTLSTTPVLSLLDTTEERMFTKPRSTHEDRKSSS